MKKLALMTLSSLLVSTAAYAGDEAALCHMLSSQQAMSAAYQPGVDVNGKPVTPADVNAPATSGLSDVIRVPVTVDLARQLSANWPAGTQMQAEVATLEVHKDGKVILNGQDVTSTTTTVCANVPKQEETPVEGKPAHKAGWVKHKSTKAAAAHKAVKQKEASEPNGDTAMPVAAEAPVNQQAVPPPAAMPAPATPAPAAAAPVPATTAAPPALEAPQPAPVNNPFADKPTTGVPAGQMTPPGADQPVTVGKPMGGQGAAAPTDGQKPAAWPTPNAQ